MKILLIVWTNFDSGDNTTPENERVKALSEACLDRSYFFLKASFFFELIIFLKSNVKDIIILKKIQQKNENQSIIINKYGRKKIKIKKQRKCSKE